MDSEPVSTCSSRGVRILSLSSDTPSLCCIRSSFSLRTRTPADPLFVKGLPILRVPSIDGEQRNLAALLFQVLLAVKSEVLKGTALLSER